MNLERPIAPEPYSLLPQVPSFTLESSAFADGEKLPHAQLADGENTSPDLSWHGFPENTQSFIVTCFDPDAPTPSGFWHWVVVDLDSNTTHLDAGAGKSDLFLPGAASHVRNDASEYAYYGAAPPQGDHDHRYIFAVHALDVPVLEVDPGNTTPAEVAFVSLSHTIARATLTALYRH